MTKMSKHLKNFFELATDENDNFSHLVRKYGIDPETDFRSADFTGVDFGKFRAQKIDLSNCILTDANLSQVHCKNIILQNATLHGTKLPDNATVEKNQPSRERWLVKLDLLKLAALAVFRYDTRQANIDLLLSQLNNSRTPVGLSFQTESEQKYYTKKIVNWISNPIHAPPEVQIEEVTNPELIIPRRIIWFYTRVCTQVID